MGANNSNTKYHENICNTPPKIAHRLLFDPRSPTVEISRTPIQIDSQAPAQNLKLYNHVMPHIIGPNISISENNENNYREQKLGVDENETKRSSGVEPTLDPTKVLTALVANNNGQLPPYQL